MRTEFYTYFEKIGKLWAFYALYLYELLQKY